MFTLSCEQKIGIFAKPSSKYLSQDFLLCVPHSLWTESRVLLIRNRGDMWQAAIFKTRRTLSFINLEREKYQDSKGVFVWSKPSKWKELMVLLIKTSFSRLLDNILTTIKKSSCVLRLSRLTNPTDFGNEITIFQTIKSELISGKPSYMSQLTNPVQFCFKKFKFFRTIIGTSSELWISSFWRMPFYISDWIFPRCFKTSDVLVLRSLSHYTKKPGLPPWT